MKKNILYTLLFMTGSFLALSVSAQTLHEPAVNTIGLELSKKVVDASDGKYNGDFKLVLDAYATGAEVTTIDYTEGHASPVDFVLVLESTRHMMRRMGAIVYQKTGSTIGTSPTGIDMYKAKNIPGYYTFHANGSSYDLALWYDEAHSQWKVFNAGTKPGGWNNLPNTAGDVYESKLGVMIDAADMLLDKILADGVAHKVTFVRFGPAVGGGGGAETQIDTPVAWTTIPTSFENEAAKNAYKTNLMSSFEGTGTNQFLRGESQQGKESVEVRVSVANALDGAYNQLLNSTIQADGNKKVVLLLAGTTVQLLRAQNTADWTNSISSAYNV